MMDDASPEVLGSMKDAPDIHEEEVLTGEHLIVAS